MVTSDVINTREMEKVQQRACAASVCSVVCAGLVTRWEGSKLSIWKEMPWVITSLCCVEISIWGVM